MRSPAVLLPLAALLWVSGLGAQTPVDTAQAADTSALRVFLDCPGFVPGCDFSFFRTEITFVNHVRDRADAQVHVLITAQRTGGGGQEITLAFIGLERFAGTVDTLQVVTDRDATTDENRRDILQRLRLGLVRFAAKTPIGAQIQVSFTAPPRAAAQVLDPWNYWVFSLSGNGFFNGEKTYRFMNLFASLSASRVTEQWKLTFSANASYNQNDFEVPVFDSTGTETGTRTVTSITRSYGGNALIVRSLGARWSAGFMGSAFSSTFSNQDLSLRIAPALEFAVFPYSESTRRYLTLQYQLGGARFEYRDTTIFNRTEETLLDHRLVVAVDIKQPWGSARFSVEGGHFLHDFAKNRLEFFGGGQVRLFKGLSFRLSGNVELIHDQLFIAKGTASEQEILLRRRQLETSYRYFASVGLEYRFGSKFANIVNPRFGDSGGVFFFF